MTEDQLAEQAELLIQLGSDAAGSAVRARLQSASLLSDMESFKAANPGCELGDFVRWHSPRDWSEEVGLSHRMRCPGNVWAELWDQARVGLTAHIQNIYCSLGKYKHIALYSNACARKNFTVVKFI